MPKYLRALRGVAIAILVINVVQLVCSWLFIDYWLFEITTHFLPQQLALVAFCAAMIVAQRSRPLGAAIIAAFVTVSLVQKPGYIRHSSEASAPVLQVISFNVLYENDNYAEVEKWLLKSLSRENENIVLLVEASEDWTRGMAELKKKLPYHIERVPSPAFGMALYSSVPLDEVKIEQMEPISPPVVTGKVKISGKEVRLYGVHTLPPTGQDWFEARNKLLATLGEAVKADATPTILMGDLNCSPWSPKMRLLTNSGKLVDPFEQLMRPHTWSALPGLVTTPIDHILHSKELVAKDVAVGPHMGSDHRPLVARFSWSHGEGTGVRRPSGDVTQR